MERTAPDDWLTHVRPVAGALRSVHAESRHDNDDRTDEHTDGAHGARDALPREFDVAHVVETAQYKIGNDTAEREEIQNVEHRRVGRVRDRTAHVSTSMRSSGPLTREGLLGVHAAHVLAGCGLRRGLADILAGWRLVWCLAREGVLGVHGARVLAGWRLVWCLAREGVLRRITVGVLVAHGVSLVSGVASSCRGIRSWTGTR